jgi:hypothetical protein
MMDISTLMVTVYCLIDDWLKGKTIRTRGPQPRLSDSEVLMMEVVGALLEVDSDQGLYTYFRRHWGDWFPALRRLHRTTFTRQMANLWVVKEQLWRFVLTQLDYDDQLSLVDSMPLPVIRFARAYRSRRLREWSGWGWDDVEKHVFYGLRVHLRLCWPGVIAGFALHPADLHDRWVGEDLTTGVQGYVLGDTNYWSPTWAETLAQQGARLVTPRKTSTRKAKHEWPKWLIQTRRRIETVYSQLTERFRGKRLRVHDPWHLTSHWLRLVLSHTVAVWLAQGLGLESCLRFADLLTD